MNIKLYVIILISLPLTIFSQDDLFVTTDNSNDINIDGINFRIDKEKGAQIIYARTNTGVVSALINANHEVVVQSTDEIRIKKLISGYLVIQNGILRYYSNQGILLTLPNFFDIDVINENWAIVSLKPNSHQIYNLKTLQPFYSVFCKAFVLDKKQKVISVSKDCKKSDIIDLDDFNEELNFKYTSVKSIQTKNHSNVILASLSPDEYGTLNIEREIIIPFIHSSLNLQEGYFIGAKGKYYGISNYQDSILFEYTWDNIVKGIRENEFILNKNEKYGVMSLNKETIIPFEYDQIFKNRCNQNSYTIGKYRIGRLSFDNKIILPRKYKSIYETTNYNGDFLGYIVQDSNEKWALFDPEGNALTNFIFNDFSIGYRIIFPLTVTIGDNKFEINDIGECVSNCPNEDILNFYELKKASNNR